MEATTENLSMLSDLLTQSLSPRPEIRHPAEKNLNATELQPGFLLLVLALVKDDRAPLEIRQAAGVYFKNVVRKRWSEVSLLVHVYLGFPLTRIALAGRKRKSHNSTGLLSSLNLYLLWSAFRHRVALQPNCNPRSARLLPRSQAWTFRNSGQIFST